MNLIGVIILLLLFFFSFIGLFIRNIRWVSLTCLVVSVGFAIVRWKIESNWAHAFDSIPKTSTIESVLRVAGKPTFISSDPRGPLGYSLMTDNPSIKREVWYVSFFAPEQFVFGFDASGSLVDRNHYSSP